MFLFFFIIVYADTRYFHSWPLSLKSVNWRLARLESPVLLVETSVHPNLSTKILQSSPSRSVLLVVFHSVIKSSVRRFFGTRYKSNLNKKRRKSEKWKIIFSEKGHVGSEHHPPFRSFYALPRDSSFLLCCFHQGAFPTAWLSFEPIEYKKRPPHLSRAKLCG